jgi:hypothetical protein
MTERTLATIGGQLAHTAEQAAFNIHYDAEIRREACAAAAAVLRRLFLETGPDPAPLTVENLWKSLYDLADAIDAAA